MVASTICHHFATGVRDVEIRVKSLEMLNSIEMAGKMWKNGAGGSVVRSHVSSE